MMALRNIHTFFFLDVDKSTLGMHIGDCAKVLICFNLNLFSVALSSLSSTCYFCIEGTLQK